MPLQATSGAASYDAFGGGVPYIPQYIEEVFSTWLYTGNGSTQTINNGIDLAGKGGLVWIKNRVNAGRSHALSTNAATYLSSNTTGAALDGTSYINAFNSDGFTGGANVNQNGEAIVSWTFRKQPKFFDVVTYTTVSGAMTIPHNLGAVPGCWIIKSTNATGSWWVHHRSIPGELLRLNGTSAVEPGFSTATSTNITISNGVYSAGTEIVIYLFAHNAGGFGLTNTDNVISCGSFTSTGSVLSINLGYEPQWLLFKRSSGLAGWVLVDNMRGFQVDRSGSTVALEANTSAAETAYGIVGPTSTGFTFNDGGSSDTYIYIAIRRGPMRTPTTGTSVFYPQAISQADSIDSTGVPFPPDLVNTFSRNGTDRASTYNSFLFLDRLRGIGVPNNTYTLGGAGLVSSSTAVEISGSTFVQLKADSQNITRASGWNAASYGNWIYYFMRRAPGFMDVVCYTGTGAARTVAHNLGAVPELMIVKNRSSAASWLVYSAATGSSWYLVLNLTREKFEDAAVWNNTTPTAGVFSLGNAWVEANQSGQTYVAYLFASCPGVSKAGGYTGTGTTQTINCGFTTGARFVLIKRTDVDGFAWYVWDSARGIVAGNDPYLLLNSTAAEVTSTDFIDTAATGFEISSTAPAAINASGGTFIFLAIA